MRIHLALFGLSSMITGFLVGLPGDQHWIIFPAIIQGYTSFRLWKELS